MSLKITAWHLKVVAMLSPSLHRPPQTKAFPFECCTAPPCTDCLQPHFKHHFVFLLLFFLNFVLKLCMPGNGLNDFVLPPLRGYRMQMAMRFRKVCTHFQIMYKYQWQLMISCTLAVGLSGTALSFLYSVASIGLEFILKCFYTSSIITKATHCPSAVISVQLNCACTGCFCSKVSEQMVLLVTK